MFRERQSSFGMADDWRCSFSEKGSVVPTSTYYRVCQDARLLVASPLARRPYDLRHSGAVDPARLRARRHQC